MEMFSAVVEVHRNGRPTGRTWATEGDPSEEAHSDHWLWRMQNIEIWAGFESLVKAEQFAESCVIVDDQGWTQWDAAHA